VTDATVSARLVPKVPLHALPWLPRPSNKIRDQIGSLPADPLAALQAAQTLAQAGLDEAELRLLGRKVRSIRKSAPAALPAEARKLGSAPRSGLDFCST
jgi:hypothetical protein